jgi:hypothetical protein
VAAQQFAYDRRGVAQVLLHRTGQVGLVGEAEVGGQLPEVRLPGLQAVHGPRNPYPVAVSGERSARVFLLRNERIPKDERDGLQIIHDHHERRAPRHWGFGMMLFVLLRS